MKPTIFSLLLFTTLLCRPAFCGEIHDTARDGDLERIRTLLKDNPGLVFSKDNDGWTPLHFAAANGHMEVVELLLANKAEVNAEASNGWTPLRLATLRGHKDIAELLRKYGSQDTVTTVATSTDAPATTTATTDTTIHDAAKNGDLEKVKGLLKANPDLVSSKDDDGMTALHLAAMKGHKDVVELLLTNKADVNAKNNYGATPLKLVELSGRDDVEKLLHEHAVPTKSTTVDLLTAVSVLVQQSSPILEGTDGFLAGGTVAISVDQTSGQTVVEGGSSFNGTRFEFMTDSLGRIDLHVTPGQHSEFQNDAKGNFISANTSDTQIANIHFQTKNNLNLVNVTVHKSGSCPNSGNMLSEY
ncbi:MAG: ankyrin repeat domain-containing protein [Limisphaerales bacterium]